MSVSHPDRHQFDGFSIEPRDRFSEVSRSLVDREVQPGRTISLLGEVDLSEINRLQALSWTRRKISYTAFVVKAVALALRDFPQANRRVYSSGFWPLRRSKVQSFTSRDVAVAVERDIEGGDGMIVTNIIRAADEAPLDQITTTVQVLSKADLVLNSLRRETNRLVIRFPCWLASWILSRPLSSPKLWVAQRGGAILVTSMFNERVDTVIGTWSHPIALSFGVIKPRAVVIDEAVVARSTFVLSLNFDRRVLAGGLAARFFKRIVTILEHPTREFGDFAVTAGYFFEHAKTDGPLAQDKQPSPGGPTAAPVLPEERKPSPSSNCDAPSTRLDFPTLDFDRLANPETLPEIPDTREDLPPIPDHNPG